MTDTTFNQIRSVITKHSDFLQDYYNVDNIGIFGSMAKGRYRKSSDIDILVELSKPLGIFKFLELEDFLKKILRRKVDLVTKGALKQAIKEKVLKEIIYV